DSHIDRLLDRQTADHVLKLPAVLDRLGGNLGEYVACLDSGLGRRRIDENARDLHAAAILQPQLCRNVGVQRLDLDTKVATMDHSLPDQLTDDVFGDIARDGHAHSLPAAALALDRRVDADDLPFKVHERSAAV